jgi:hypothetical protein
MRISAMGREDLARTLTHPFRGTQAHEILFWQLVAAVWHFVSRPDYQTAVGKASAARAKNQVALLGETRRVPLRR